MKKVLVTGGGGFIGSYVTDELLSLGYKVLILDHSYPGIWNGADRENVEYFHGDVMDDVAVTEAAAHVDGIIHLAAVLGTQETIGNPRPAARTNILGSLNVLEAANQYDLPVTYAGVGNYWMREHGAGTYTITKTAVEDFARMFNQFRGSRVSVARPVNAYGPRQSVAAPYGSSKVRKIMPSFICRALMGDPIEVYGDGSQVSDCVHVTDVARTFVRVLEYTDKNGPLKETIDVGPSDSVTVQQIAEGVRRKAFSLTGAHSKIVNLPMRPGEVPNAVVAADTSKLAQVGLSADNFVPLNLGINETVQWYYENWYPNYKKFSEPEYRD